MAWWRHCWGTNWPGGVWQAARFRKRPKSMTLAIRKSSVLEWFFILSVWTFLVLWNDPRILCFMNSMFPYTSEVFTWVGKFKNFLSLKNSLLKYRMYILFDSKHSFLFIYFSSGGEFGVINPPNPFPRSLFVGWCCLVIHSHKRELCCSYLCDPHTHTHTYTRSPMCPFQPL